MLPHYIASFQLVVTHLLFGFNVRSFQYILVVRYTFRIFHIMVIQLYPPKSVSVCKLMDLHYPLIYQHMVYKPGVDQLVPLFITSELRYPSFHVDMAYNY